MVILSENPSSVQVSWSPVSGASPGTQYEIQILYRPLSTSTVQFKRADIAATQIEINGLQDSTKYEFYIRLVCSSGGVGRLNSQEGVTVKLLDTCTLHMRRCRVTDCVMFERGGGGIMHAGWELDVLGSLMTITTRIPPVINVPSLPHNYLFTFNLLPYY